jgi:hypothetical protein
MRPPLPGSFGFLVAGIVATVAVMVIVLALGSWALHDRGRFDPVTVA